jgi:hypothetical protein
LENLIRKNPIIKNLLETQRSSIAAVVKNVLYEKKIQTSYETQIPSKIPKFPQKFTNGVLA